MEKIEKNEEFLLDLFANHAMNAIVTMKYDNFNPPEPDWVAKTSYNIATAMILERRKRLPDPKRDGKIDFPVEL
jgi:hypothetical protein